MPKQSKGKNTELKFYSIDIWCQLIINKGTSSVTLTSLSKYQ